MESLVDLCERICAYKDKAHQGNVDDLLQVLFGEVHELSKVLLAIRENAPDTLQTGREEEYWRNIGQVIYHCKLLLESLETSLQRNKLDLRGDIESYNRDLEGYRQPLQLSLQMITVSRVVKNAEECVRSASEVIMSVASLIITPDSTLLSRNRWNGGVEESNNPQEHVETEGQSGSGSNKSPFTESALSFCWHRYSCSFSQNIKPINFGKHALDLLKSDSEPEIDIDLINILWANIKDKVNLREYSQAENFVKRVLKRCEEKYGTIFARRDEILKILAAIYRKQKKWEEAAEILTEVLENELEEGSDGFETMLELAEVCLRKKEINVAERFCRKVVEGRKTALGTDQALFHQSVVLLVSILEVRGELYEAEAWRLFLPPQMRFTPRRKSEIKDSIHQSLAPRQSNALRKIVGNDVGDSQENEVIVSIIDVDSFRHHSGFDLASFTPWDAEAQEWVHLYYVKKSLTWMSFYKHIAEEIHVRWNHIRLWSLVRRHNKTLRPDEPVPPDVQMSMSFYLSV